jgi:hypothetical protein
VPRPGDPQSLNRYSYTSNNPVSRIDPDGHADKNPLDEFLCKINPAACLPEPQLTPNGGGEVLNVNAGSVEAVADPTTGTVMAKGSGTGVGQRIKEGVESAVTNLCKGLLAIICGGAASKAAEKAKKAIDAVAPTAYEIAKAGGRHAGFLHQFSAKSLREIDKSIRSFETNIAKHLDYIADPLKKVSKDVWDRMDPRQQQGLIEHWNKEIQDWQQQIEILRRIRQERGGN